LVDDKVGVKGSKRELSLRFAPFRELKANSVTDMNMYRLLTPKPAVRQAITPSNSL
jgi:hypothetical protein